ncbi:MAG: TIGR02099 family protein [Proteobacteria bacterium]|nr:TIGR02099 family protein [Pseudomonadota bacterium]
MRIPFLPAPFTTRWPALTRGRLLRFLLWTVLAGYFLFGVLYLLLRLAVMPQVAGYRGEVERLLSTSLQRPVTISRLDGGWEGLRPRLLLRGLDIMGRTGHPALHLDQVEAVVGWESLLRFTLHLHRLEIQGPDLQLRRAVDGRLFIADLPVDTSREDTGLSDWLLSQDRIVVRGARVRWLDERRAAPPLMLDELNFDLHNGFIRHRFGFTGRPPSTLAGPVDIRGEFHSPWLHRSLRDLARWRGQIYASLGNTDLAGWRAWLDYPVDLPHGHGGLNLWVDLEGLHPVGLTADVALADVQIRLAKNLPMLDLDRLTGRVHLRVTEDERSLTTRALSLRTREGIAVAPTDFHVRWRPLEGEFSANQLDVHVLARLADYLPLTEDMRARLKSYSPQGRFIQPRFSWQGRHEPFEHYRTSGRFEGLAVASLDQQPGFSGFSGSIEGDETGGNFTFDGKDAVLELPAVFPQPRLAFTHLTAEGRWKRNGKDMTLTLVRSRFANADAEGEASGTYHHLSGRGEIDLDARISHADGRAVWRYLPGVVSDDVRLWLKDALLGGKAEGASLKLRGDLSHFPFVDNSGIFRIQAAIKDASLKFASGWPQIDGIDGTLEFERARMTITASRGRMAGANLAGVKAEIADLEAPEELMTISGKAGGATAAFLQFIEDSPVGERIDHFTQAMKATGNGELDLLLHLPLRHLENAKVNGGYRFDGDKIKFNPDLPPLEDVRGRIEFTADSLKAKGVRGRMLGGPAQVDMATDREGGVAVDARGEINVAQLRQQMPQPVFDYLSGTARWAGAIRVKQRNVAVRLSSDLKGLTSTLPEPFNKPATEARPVVFERKPPDPKLLPPVRRSRPGTPPVPAVPRDQIELTWGKALHVQLLRRIDGDKPVVERGLLGIGDVTPRLPERGTLLALNMPRLDLDLLRSLSASGKDSGKAEEDGAGLDLGQIEVRADEAVAFGRQIHDLRLTGSRRAGPWSAEVRSREITGHLEWNGAGAGRISGRIAQFSLPPAETAMTTAPARPASTVSELPAIDLVFDHFNFRNHDLGEVRLTAENKAGDWNFNVAMQNDDGNLNAQGRWRPGGEGPDTHLDLRLKAKSIEKTLGRIGYVDAVRRGNATLEGSFAWEGPPYSIDYPTLDGSLKIEARDGQFNKLEPGVGRLLGILSLQSLPRRITLDFRDVFSEGFAFDAIDGTARISRGVMDTRDLEIRGPAARVAMQGSVDLTRETQNLKVRIQPALGETVATGVLLANPATGAAAWVFNKLFGGPLDRIFAYEYTITGAWADPRVEKSGAPGKDAVPKIPAAPAAAP